MRGIAMEDPIHYQRRPLRHKFSYKFLIVVALSLIANVFFFEAPIGWTAGAFGIMGIGAVCLTRPLGQFSYALIGLCLGLCLSLWDQPSILSGLLLWLGVCALAINGQRRSDQSLLERTKRTLLHGSVGPFAIFPASRAFIRAGHMQKPAVSFPTLRLMALPLAFLVLFVLLFRSANPFIEQALSQFDFNFLATAFSMRRVLFFLVCIALLLGLVRPRMKMVMSRTPSEGMDRSDSNLTGLFSGPSLILSLVVFNVLFAVQNISDITYLWSGITLPSNMTYAEYAHRGAYPLIVTALLAAVFVLLASHSRAQSPKLQQVATLLTLIWLGQNVFLVFSSVNRTLSYVDVYALTLLRLSALVWMGLVALGVLFLFVKTLKDKSVAWLINGNLLSVIVVLYFCAGLDMSAYVAHYNVRHSKPVRGHGVNLDISYIESLGTPAIPALIWLETNKLNYPTRVRLRNALSALEMQVDEKQSDWRGWTYKNRRLKKMLDARTH